MAFITNMLMRPALSRSSNTLFHNWGRGFSTKVVGPAPRDVLNISEQEFFQRNLDRLRQDGKITFATTEPLVTVPRAYLDRAMELFLNISRQNEHLHGELKVLNAKVEQLVNSSHKTS